MPGDSKVFALLEEMLETGRTAEEACRDCHELLPEVRRRWTAFRAVDAEFSALLPAADAVHDAETLWSTSRSGELPDVPGYRVEELLGAGGMGVVYRAWHLRLDRPVALKMLLAGSYARPDERARIVREAQAIAALCHPNIVQVHDAGEVDGRPYFTMELLAGGDLARRTRGQPQPALQAAELVATIADAVHAAHEHGIVHRDLKPNNILLAEDGTPKVSDFGLARRIEGDDRLTFTGVQMGTPSYMSPEQARGPAGDVGPAADVYALGAILYDLLTGRPPFRAESPVATVHQVLNDDPVSPSRLNPRVPRDLETVCRKCLHKEPHRRYASAKALAEDLRRFHRGDAIEARRMGRLELAMLWVRRRPAVAAATTCGALLASALLVTLLWWTVQRMELSASAVAYAEADLRESRRLRDEGKFEAAAAVLRRAKDRLREFVPDDIDRSLSTEFDDLELVTRLDAIRLERVVVTPPAEMLGVLIPPAKDVSLEPTFGSPGETSSAQHYQTAFRDAGIGVGDDPAKTAAKIQASPVRVAFVSALDDWSACSSDLDQQTWIFEILRRADPNPWRDRVRDPATWADPEALRDLAANVPIEDQPPHLLAVLGARLRAKEVDAIALMRRAASVYPADFWVNVEMGNALFNAKNAEEAIGYYRAALALRPETISLHYALGGLYLSLQRWEQAIAEYEQAVRLDPENPWCRVRLGFTLAWKGDRDKDAIERFQEAIRIDPDQGWAHFYLAIALERQKAFEEAVEEFEEAARRLPEKRVEAKQKARGLMLKLGRGAEALTAWQKELASRPPTHDDWFGYAELCLFLGDETEYRRARSELLAEFGATEDPSVAERTARAFLLLPAEEAELEQAAALADRAVTMARPWHQYALPFFRFAQGLARYRQGRYDEAIEVMEGDAAPVMGPCPRLVLAMALHRTGQNKRAQKVLTAAIGSYPWDQTDASDHDRWIGHILRREAESLIEVEVAESVAGESSAKE